ncbi:pyridoxamine 5'-phosphate oxidase family protein [Clostridium saccharoperbutylacetonicum]|uniref:pyridoxamine 5'-phosphate oxidase family protein n=1 Tax=Clostridium saccharoperbutylacetonicum TaxID=36745 RepID=UPI0039E7E30F
MEQIRYTQRICGDKNKINNFLEDKRVGALSMCDEYGNPYVIPVNYIYLNEKIYIHGMGSGKKNRIIETKPSVCFTVFEEFGTVVDIVPCKCDTSYFSIVIMGKMFLVKDINEKTQVLTKLVEKFMPNFFKNPLSNQFVEKYKSSFDKMPVSVYCLSPEILTAKENPIDIEHMFKNMKQI